jgi:hypothetical protein
MNTLKVRVGIAVCMMLALVSTVNAQEKPPAQGKASAVHRMELYNGPYRTVHYFSDGASEAEQAKLRDEEQRENETAITNQLNALLRQYLADESVLQRRRRDVQLRYYGHSSVATEWLVGGQVTAYPYGYDGFHGWNGYYGSGYLPGTGYVPGTVTYTNGLSGVGDEGPLKAELIRALAVRLIPREPTPPPAPK